MQKTIEALNGKIDRPEKERERSARRRRGRLSRSRRTCRRSRRRGRPRHRRLRAFHPWRPPPSGRCRARTGRRASARARGEQRRPGRGRCGGRQPVRCRRRCRRLPSRRHRLCGDGAHLAGRRSAAPIDPSLRGFLRIPNTRVMIRFNAKPRVDFTYDPENTGDDNRFVTAKIPVFGSPEQGGGPVFNANARARSWSSTCAPEVDGSPRFYYQNDFYGSGGGEFPYRAAAVRVDLRRHRRADVQPVRGSRHLAGHRGLRGTERDGVRPLSVGALPPRAARRSRAQLGLAASSDVASTEGNTVEDGTTRLTSRAEPARRVRAWPLPARHGTAISARKSDVFGEDTAFGKRQSRRRTEPRAAVVRDRPGSPARAGTWGAGIGRYGNDTSFSATDAGSSTTAVSRSAAVLRRVRRLHAPLAARLAVDGDVCGWVTRRTVHAGRDQGTTRRSTPASISWQLRDRLSVGVEALYGDNQAAEPIVGRRVPDAGRRRVLLF